MNNAIENILNNFDFGYVYRMMESGDWTWFDSNGITPSVEMLRKEARRLLTDVKEGGCILCGGLMATKNYGTLSLYFVGESRDAEIDRP